MIGKSEYQLEVLKDSTPDVVEEGKRFIEEKRIHISLKENIEEKLYIEVGCGVREMISNSCDCRRTYHLYIYRT